MLYAVTAWKWKFGREKERMKVSDVKAVNKLPDEGAQAFRRGEVEAVITYEPDLGKLLREKGAHLVFTSREIPGEIVDVMATPIAPPICWLVFSNPDASPAW